MKVEIFSDVVCPWCYIGHKRFARAARVTRAWWRSPTARSSSTPRPRPRASRCWRRCGASSAATSRR
ncbi:DsbA family protein [Nonomuraea dietziae]|uniref:DsbA family protein n=1 Tax=Nonomuraea dietziae TaxID=65515 RepID=UPI003CD09743